MVRTTWGACREHAAERLSYHWHSLDFHAFEKERLPSCFHATRGNTVLLAFGIRTESMGTQMDITSWLAVEGHA